MPSPNKVAEKACVRASAIKSHVDTTKIATTAGRAHSATG